MPPRGVSHPLERHIRATRLYLSMLVVRNPTTRCPVALQPLSAPLPPPPRPPTPSCPALSRVRPSSHRHPVHSPSFLMLGSYSRCAARAVPLSFSLSLRVSPCPLFSALRFWLFLAVTASPSLVLFRKKKEDLGQFLSHKPADRTAPIKNASLRMAIGPQRASGVMPNRSLSPSSPRGLPFAVGVSFRRAFSSSLLVFLVRSLVLLYLFRSFLLFFQRGEKMRAARRLVEGTDDVVSDVPPPALGVGMHARRW